MKFKKSNFFLAKVKVRYQCINYFQWIIGLKFFFCGVAKIFRFLEIEEGRIATTPSTPLKHQNPNHGSHTLKKKFFYIINSINFGPHKPKPSSRANYTLHWAYYPSSTFHLPSQNNVTSARLSDLNKLPKAVAKLLPKLFHFRQNCCCGSIPSIKERECIPCNKKN